MIRCLSALALAFVALAPVVSSCALQGEGDRCDLDAGVSGPDADCEEGFVCTDPSKLQHSPAAAVCCPADGSFTTIVCTPKQANTSSSTASSTASSGQGGDATGGAGGTGTTASGQGGATASGQGGSTSTGQGGDATGGAGGTSTTTTTGQGGSST